MVIINSPHSKIIGIIEKKENKANGRESTVRIGEGRDRVEGRCDVTPIEMN